MNELNPNVYFLNPPDWSTMPEFTFKQNVDKLGSIGKMDVDILEAYPKLMPSYSFLCEGEEIRSIEDFFVARFGRLSTFWMPSWMQDIRLTSDAGPSDTVLNVEDIGWRKTYYGQEASGQIICSITGDARNPTFNARRIVDATLLTLTLESPFGVTVRVDDLISFVYVVRFDQDELEWVYLTSNLAATRIRFKEIA